MRLKEGKPYTAGERRAWRAGFLAGVEQTQQQLELFRWVVCVRGTPTDAPTHWPNVVRARPERRGAA